uniref:Putative protease n=1 Tax=termite gut metagenome TaxID=433724 RepID=S0DFN4_9ZZZZ
MRRASLTLILSIAACLLQAQPPQESVSENTDLTSIGSDELFDFENTTARGYESAGMYGECKIADRLFPLTKGLNGNDDRKEVIRLAYPYYCIARLIIIKKDGKKVEGTGFFISERCVITAAHNIYFDDTKEFAKEVTVIPGANVPLDYPVLGQATATTMRCMKKYTEDPKKNRKYDYGAVILPDDTLFENVGSYLGYNDIDSLGKSNMDMELSGYPRADNKMPRQLKSTGKITRYDEHHLHYIMDTSKGQSGSPVFIWNNKRECIVVGMHHHDNGRSNQAVRVNEAVMAKWNEWSKIKPQKQ